jgi:hypothetical protein
MTRKQRAQLGAFIAQKHRARREQERTARRAKSPTSVELEEYEPVGFHFSPRRHRLTLEQCRLATALLRRRNQENPIRGSGKAAQFRRALRIAGIVSAVKGGRVGNRRWGKRMSATKGGNTMRDHGAHILAANRRRIQEQRQFDKAQKQGQSHPQTYEAWQQATGQQQAQRPFLAW